MNLINTLYISLWTLAGAGIEMQLWCNWLTHLGAFHVQFPEAARTNMTKSYLLALVTD